MFDKQRVNPTDLWRVAPPAMDWSYLYVIIDKIEVWSPEASIVKPSMIERVIFVLESGYTDRLFALLVMAQRNLALLVGATELSFHPEHPDRYLLEHFRKRLDIHGISKRELCFAGYGTYERICEKSCVHAKDLVSPDDEEQLRFFAEWNNVS